MAIKRKRDFKKLSVCIKEFLSKLPCEENTGFLRDTLYLSLLELHKYYVKEKDKLVSSLQNPNGKEMISLKNSGQFYHGAVDKYESRWCGYNDDSKEIESQGFLAAHQGNIGKLKDIVREDDVDSFGQTYLMYAVHNQSTHQAECIGYLLSLKFDINSQANDGSTALHVACQYEQKQCVITLLRNKTDPRIQDNKGRTPLHWAAISSSSDITQILLQHGADINAKDCDGMTPIMWACYMNQAHNLQLLKHALERLDPQPLAVFDDRDNEGRTVLDWAIATGNKHDLQCLKDLLVSEVSHIKNKEGRTVLHIAAQQGCVSACEVILSKCGKEILHARDNKNQSALHLATLCGHGETVDYLLQFGAKMSDTNGSGRTALQEAQFGHYHYCLLVFAAFEQMRMSGEKNKQVEKTLENNENNAETKRYESWVIPTGFLHDSLEIPDTPTKNENQDNQLESFHKGSKNTGKQLSNIEHQGSKRSPRRKQSPEIHHITDSTFPKENMDVTEIEGFEINEEIVMKDTPNNRTENTSYRENSNETQDHSKDKTKNLQNTTRENSNGESRPRFTSTKTGTLQRSLGFDEEKHVKKQTAIVEENARLENGHNEQTKCESEKIRDEQSDSPILSSEPENESISENIEVSSLGDDEETETSENDKTEQDDSENEDSKKENISETKEKSEVKTDTKVENLNFPNAKSRRGNLEPLSNPLTKPGFSIPSKLDPIPLHLMTKKGSPSENNRPFSPRGIVAPLQPPPPLDGYQNDHSLVAQEMRVPAGSTSMYGKKGPGHGPLAHAQGKALLTGVFQDTSKIQEQKTPETIRKDTKSGKLPHPPRI